MLLCTAVCLSLTVAASAAASSSGSAGKNIRWEVTGDGVLTFTGSGSIVDYPEDPAPWLKNEIRKVIIGEGITAVGDYAFNNEQSITEVSLPSTLKSIGDSAFYNCALTDITLPEGLEKVEHSAFRGTKLEKLVLPESVTSVGGSAFSGCKLLADVEIRGEDTAMGANAFSGCPLLTTAGPISSDESYDIRFAWVTAIPDYAFTCCESLESVDIPWDIRSIGIDAFGGCTALTEVYLPENVCTIGNGAFAGCDALREVHLSKNLHTICMDAFYGCPKLDTVVYPATQSRWDALTAHYDPFENHTNILCLPGSTSITVEENSSGKPYLRWSKVEGADSYILVIYEDVVTHLEPVKQVKTQYTNINHTSAQPGKSYAYEVVPVKNGYEGGCSDTVWFTVSTGIPAPEIDVTENSSGKPRISWNKVDGADKYYLYIYEEIYDENGDWVKDIFSKRVTSTYSYINHTSATPGVGYGYRVSAVVDGREGDLCDVYWFRVSTGIDAPEVDITENSSGKPRLSWNKVDGAKKYTVKIYEEVFDEHNVHVRTVFLKTVTTTNTYLNHNSAIPGKTYGYEVVAVADGVTGDRSIRLWYDVSTGIEAPEISVEVNDLGWAVVSWDSVPGAEKYCVYITEYIFDGNRGAVESVPLAPIVTANTYLKHSTTILGNAYVYEVSAVVDGITGDRSQYWYYTIPAPDVEVELNAAGKPKLSWNKVDGADKYVLYIYEEIYDENGDWVDTVFVKRTTTSYNYINHTSAENRKQYSYQVSAIVDGIESVGSNWISIYVPSNIPIPQAEVDLNSAGKPKVTWNKVDGVEKYALYIYEEIYDENGYWVEDVLVKRFVTSNTYTNHNSAEVRKHYCYQVAAIVNGEEGELSGWVSIYVPSGIPAPQAEVDLNSSDKPKVTWNKVDGAEKYALYIYQEIYDENGNWIEDVLVKRFVTSNTYTNHNSAETGKHYCYQVAAIVNGEESELSDWCSIYVPTGIPAPEINVDLNSAGKPKVTWNKVDGASQYALYIYEELYDGDGQYLDTVFVKRFVTSNTYTNHNSAEFGKTYAYEVAAIVGGVEGDKSVWCGITVQ